MLTRIDWYWAVVLSFASGILYAATAAKSALGGDNSEFLAVAHGGIAHPSGYPLYTMYLRATQWIPAESPAHTAALATALLGVATVLVMFLAARQWGASRVAAGTATLVLSLSPRFWLAATHAEVFMLNALIASVLLALAAPTGVLGARRAVWLAVVAGLGLSNHLTIALMAPVGLAALWRNLRASRSTVGTACLALGALVLGLTPNLYLLVAGHKTAAWSWGQPSSLSGLLDHVLRHDYGLLSLGISSSDTSALQQVYSLISQVAQDFLWLPVAVILASLFPLCNRYVVPGRCVKRDAHSEFWPANREAYWSLLATLILAGPIFVSRFNLETTSLSYSIVERFYLLPELLVALGCALLATWVGRHGLACVLSKQWRNSLRQPAVTALAMTFLGGASLLANCREVEAHHSPAVEKYLLNTLRSTPKDSVILGSGDHRVFGFAYVQGVLGVRSDVIYIDPRLLHYPWYADRTALALGVRLPPVTNSNIDTAKLAQVLLDSGRPLFLANLVSMRIVRSFGSYPFGTLIRILSASETAVDPIAAAKLNFEVYQQFDMNYPLPRDPSTWAWATQLDYVRTWRLLGDALSAEGHSELAAESYLWAARLSPKE